MYVSRGAMDVDRVSVTFVFSVALCAFTHTTAHCSCTEGLRTPGSEHSNAVPPLASLISNVDNPEMDVVGSSGQFDSNTVASPDSLYGATLANSQQDTPKQAVPHGSRSVYLSPANDVERYVIHQVVQPGEMPARESPSSLSGNFDRRLLDGTHEPPKHATQGSCPHQLPQRLFPMQSQNSIAEARRTSTARKRSYSLVSANNLIIKWDIPCLRNLPTKLDKIQHTLEDVEKEELEVHLFYEGKSAEESRSSGGGNQNFMEEPLVYRRGVFHRDRVNMEVPQRHGPSEHQGRSYALSIIAGALGVQVRYRKQRDASSVLSNPANASQDGDYGCGSTCREELEQLFASSNIETLQATFYPTFGVDILTFTNLTAVMQAVGVQDASALAEYLHASKSRVTSQEQSKLTEAGQCIESLSFDRAGKLQGKSNFSVLDGSLNDKEYIKQWHHMSRLSNYSLWSDVAWEDIPVSVENAEAKATVVGLIDSGCYLHEDYWASESDTSLWRNQGETDCDDQIDNDGNGYVDDCWGWDFITNTNDVFSDYTSHGTSLASLLVGRHNDEKGGAGVMKFGKVMCLRAATQGVIYLSTLVGAFDYALRNGARISVHAYTFAKAESYLQALFESAYERDHLAVVSAGSHMCDLDADPECTVYPASYGAPSTLVVGSSNLSGGACCGTNWGKNGVHVFAAGSRIYAGSCVNHKDHEKLNCKNCYAFMYGSSISAGLTAGVAAMVWAYMRKMNPIGWSASTEKESIRIKKALIYSSMPSARIAGACEANGIINMYRALHYYDTVPAGQFVPTYKDYPTLFRWSLPPFFQGAGDGAANLISPSTT